MISSIRKIQEKVEIYRNCGLQLLGKNTPKYLM